MGIDHVGEQSQKFGVQPVFIGLQLIRQFLVDLKLVGEDVQEVFFEGHGLSRLVERVESREYQWMGRREIWTEYWASSADWLFSMMRRLFFLLVLMAPIGPLMGQKTDTVTVVPVTESEDHVYSRVEQMPEFPGGKDSLMSFLSDHLRPPKNSRERGKVYVQVVVEKDGSLTSPEVARGLGMDADHNRAALDVVHSMPMWKPGMQNGKPVRVSVAILVQFGQIP